MKKLNSFFIENDAWVYLCILLFISFAFVMSVRVEGVSLHYLEKEKFLLFARYFSCYCILFSPVILLVAFKEFLLRRLSIWPYRLFWVYCFIVHPFIIGQYNWHYFFLSRPFPGEILWMYGALLAGIYGLLILELN